MKYYLQINGYPEQEVTRQEYMEGEKTLGFKPKHQGGIATASFSSGIFRGRVDYSNN